MTFWKARDVVHELECLFDQWLWKFNVRRVQYFSYRNWKSDLIAIRSQTADRRELIEIFLMTRWKLESHLLPAYFRPQEFWIRKMGQIFAKRKKSDSYNVIFDASDFFSFFIFQIKFWMQGILNLDRKCKNQKTKKIRCIRNNIGWIWFFSFCKNLPHFPYSEFLGWKIGG